MTINTSPNVLNFDFDALLDISTATAKAVLTDISTYISGGQANIIGINFKIIDPNNIAFHDTVYPPDIDLTPGLTDFEVNLPSFNGAVKWGNYKIYATLIDEDGTQYQWEENGLNYKAIKLCKPNTLIGAKGNFGGMQLLSDFDCDTNTLLVEDGTGYVYNGVAATETDTDVTVTYPVDPTGTPSYQTSTFMPFTLPISLSGVYSISAQVIQTYQYTETTSVKVAYKYQKSTDVQCGFTLCKALCEYERLASDIKNCVFKSVAETQEKQKQYLLISGLLVKILSFGKVCGKSFNTATILEEIREIGGFDCNCDCTPAAIIPQPVYAHNTIVKGSMCGDIDMVLQQVGSSVLINLSDKHYEFDVDESIADWVTFTPVTDGCTITYDVNIDFCAAITALGCGGGGGGTGTVTNFSAGDLSPLFTTSVATSTTTPALTFAQVSQNQNLVYASPDGVAGFPTFRALVAGDLPSLTGLYWGLAGNATGNDTSFLGTTTNNDFLFKTNSTTRGAFFKTGELGIGISSFPLGTLHVKGLSGQSPLYVINNAGTVFTEFTNAGNLGIGVSPSSINRLHVKGIGNTASSSVSLFAQNSDGSHSFGFYDNGVIGRNGGVYSTRAGTTTTAWGASAGLAANGLNTASVFVGYFAGKNSTASNVIIISGDTNNNSSANYGAGTVAVGNGAIIGATGTWNVAYGYSSGSRTTTGGANTYIGSYADRNDSSSTLSNITGNYNVIVGSVNLGSSAGTSYTGGNAFSSVFAVHGIGTTANQIVFGGGIADTYFTSFNIGYSSGGAKHSTYYRTSTPESNQIGNPGDIAYVNDATNGFVYLKYSGVGTNTGWVALSTSAGGVTSVSGTANRITSTGGTTPVIDIASTYVGQNSITTLGTVTTGTLSTGAIIGGVTMTLGSDGTGDIYYRNAGGILTRLAIGSNTDVLTVSGGLPSWAAAGGSVPSGTSGQTLYYSGTTLTATSNLINDGTNVGIGGTPSNLFEVIDSADAKLKVNATTFIYGAGGTEVLTARNNDYYAAIGDINGTVNGTRVIITDSASTIAYDAANGHTFTGTGVTINGKLTVTGAIDPTHLYLDEQGGDPTNVANKGILYTKDVAGLTQLYYMNSAGTVYGITPNTAGTVTTVSVTTANGISGSVATATTTPAITLTLGAITPTSVNGNTISTGTGTLSLSTFTLTVAGNASISGTNTGDQTLAGLGGANAALSNLASVAINTTLLPQTNDVPALGSATLSFSDLFLASGALINFANGDSVITHSSGILTVSTGDLRVTTAGTNAASVLTLSGTQMLTNKTITASSNVLGGVTMTLGSDATGDVYYRNSGSLLTRLGIGSTGDSLTVVSGIPAWSPKGYDLSSQTANGVTVGSGATVFAAPFFGGSFNATETNRQLTIKVAGTVGNLYVRTNSAQSGLGSLVVTVRKNGSTNTAVTLTITAGAAAGTFSDVSNTVAFAAGDLISFQIVNNAAATSANIMEVGVFVK